MALPPSTQAGRTSWLFRIPLLCVLVALGALLVPVALTRMPPLLDYPNHVARMWLLAGGAEAGPLSTVYWVDWSGATTNIGVDLVAVTLGRFVEIWTLAPILLGAAILLPPLGAVLLNRAVFGGWHWWQAGFAVLAWNSTLAAGFLNFQIGLGLALLAAASDLAISRRAGPWRAAPVRMGLASGLMVFHPFAVAFYGVLIAGLAFGAGRGAGGLELSFWLRAGRAAATAGLCMGVPILCILMLAPNMPGWYAPDGVYDIWSGYTVLNKILTLLTAFLTYDIEADFYVVVALAGAVLIAARSKLQVHSGLLLGAAGLTALALLVPSVIADAVCVDWRFPIMAALTAVAAIRPGLPSQRAGHVMAVGLLLLFLTRTGWVAGIWLERRADVAAVEDVLAFVPAGAALLPVTRLETDAAPRGRMLAAGFPS